MSLIQELEDIIQRTGSYKDREILTRVLEQLKRSSRMNSQLGYYEEKKVVRR